MALVEKSYRAMYGILFIIFALFGTSMTIIGATLPKILADFAWDYSTAGIVIGAGAVGYFVSVYAAGFLVAHIGPRLTIAIGLLLDVAGLAFFAATPSVLLNVVLYLCIGLGQGFIELVVNWSTLRMEKNGSSRAMNLMHGAFAVGAFAGPFIIGLLMRADLSWTLVFRGIAALFALMLVPVFFLPFKDLANQKTADAESSKQKALFRRSMYWFGFLALFFYVGVEIGVSNWIAEFFVSAFGASVSTGSFMVSLFWAGLLTGRFGVPLFYKGDRRDVVLLLMSILMSAAVFGLAAFGLTGLGTRIFPAAVAFVFLSGLGCSVIYPIVVTFVGGAFPHAQSQAIAFASTGGGIGCFAFPFVMANLSAAWGIRAGFAAYAVFSLAVIAACAGIVRGGKKGVGA